MPTVKPKRRPGYRFVSRKPEPNWPQTYQQIEETEAILARMVESIGRAMEKKWPMERNRRQRIRNKQYAASIEPYSPETLKTPDEKGQS